MSYFYFEFSILSSRAQLRSTFVYKIIIFVFKTLRTSFTNISIKIDSLYKQRASLFLKITILNLTTNTNSKHFSIILFKIFCTKGNFNAREVRFDWSRSSVPTKRTVPLCSDDFRELNSIEEVRLTQSQVFL